MLEHYNPIATLMHTMPKPVIAAINGAAVGIGQPVWTSDSGGLVFTEVNDNWRSYRARYHRLGRPVAEDVTLYDQFADSYLRGDAIIAVIGAGAMGASIAFHLATLGADDVVLCENSAGGATRPHDNRI